VIFHSLLPQCEVTEIPDECVRRRPHGHSSLFGTTFYHCCLWTSTLFQMALDLLQFTHIVVWATQLFNIKTLTLYNVKLSPAAQVTVRRGVEIQHTQLHTFLTVTQDRDKWCASWPSHFTLCMDWTGFWATLRGCLQSLQMSENFCTAKNWRLVTWSSTPKLCVRVKPNKCRSSV
jgi:hypothetical protein